MVGTSGAVVPADIPGIHPLRLVAVTHGAPSAENREAVIRLVDAVASERPELDVSISFVDAANRDVAASLAAAAELEPRRAVRCTTREALFTSRKHVGAVCETRRA